MLILVDARYDFLYADHTEAARPQEEAGVLLGGEVVNTRSELSRTPRFGRAESKPSSSKRDGREQQVSCSPACATPPHCLRVLPLQSGGFAVHIKQLITANIPLAAKLL